MWRSQALLVINRKGLFYNDSVSGYHSLNVDEVTNKKITELGLLVEVFSAQRQLVGS